MNTPQTPQPNTQYFNPADGATYTMKQPDPSGKGTVMVNSQTQEEQLLPNPSMQEVQMNNGQQMLKPIMKTQTLGVSMANDIDNIVNGEPDAEQHTDTSSASATDMIPAVQDHLKTDIDRAIEDIDRQAQGVEGDIAEIVDNAQLFNEVAPASGEDNVSVIDSVGLPDGDIHTETLPADKARNAVPRFMASTVAPIKVQSTPKSWMSIRRGITTKGQVSFKERQLAHLKNAGLTKLAKDLGFSPDNRDPQPSGHSEQGIPIAGPPKEKDMQIGMTEFPKDQDRDASVGLDTGKGYNVPIKEMDERQVADREKFDNEHRQYMRSMTIRQIRDIMGGNKSKEVAGIEKGKGLQSERQVVKPEDNDAYDIEKKAIALAVGLSATAIDLDQPEKPRVFNFSPKPRSATAIDLETPAPSTGGPLPKDAPVTHKPIKTAPKVDEYTEPGVIPPASKEMEVFLDKFSTHYAKLEELKDQLKSALAPHQKSIVEEQSKIMPAITEQEKLMKDALEMAYNAIESTGSRLVHYSEELWAAVSRTKNVAPAVTVPQIIAEAKLIDQHLVEQIEKLVAVVGERGKSKLRERTLYEFPPSKSHEERMTPKSSLQSTAGSPLEDLGEIIRGFLFVSSEIDEAMKLLG